ANTLFGSALADRLALSPEGSLLVADNNGSFLHRVAPPLPGVSVTDVAVPSESGSELYVFDEQGRHLRTVDVLTRAVRYQFGYDPAGRLTSVTDVDGKQTTIDRDATGATATIRGPFGDATALAFDANGYLSQVTDPTAQAFTFTYGANGL